MAGMSAVGPPGGMSGSEEPLPNPRRDDCVALSSGRFSSVHSIQGPPSKADSREGATGLEETRSPHPCGTPTGVISCWCDEHPRKTWPSRAFPQSWQSAFLSALCQEKLQAQGCP